MKYLNKYEDVTFDEINNIEKRINNLMRKHMERMLLDTGAWTRKELSEKPFKEIEKLYNQIRVQKKFDL